MLLLIGKIEAAELPTGQLVVSVYGPLDERVKPTLRDTLLPLAGADGAAVLLDLAEAYGIDAAALDVVGRAAHMIACRGERLAIITRSPLVRSLVTGCGLDEIVTLHGSLKEAIDAD